MRWSHAKRRKTGLLGLAVAAALAMAGCASTPSTPTPTSTSGATSSLSVGSQAAMENPNLDLGSSLNNAPAPDFTLVNQFGQPMKLSQFRGHVILLSFDDSECTTVCPLTTQAMLLAKELLGKAGDSVQLLGVDANSKATAVSDVMAYSQAHGMVNHWDFLTGTLPQLKSVWKAYNIAVEIEAGLIDHTPALYVINQQGIMQKVYLTQMAYSSITQSAQVIATEVSSLLPSHPKLSSLESLAAVPVQGPTAKVTLPSAVTGAAPVTLGPGKARLVVFWATWLTETSDLKAELTMLNTYASDAASKHLPAVTAVDETSTEPSVQTVTSYLRSVGPLSYPIGLDQSGRVADGYGVQDQPWLVLVNSSGKITWQHDGWVSLATLEQAAAKA